MSEKNVTRYVADWQPIETAPDDGTTVLVCADGWIWISSRKAGSCVGGLPTGWDWSAPVSGRRPTHWHPLPHLPK